MPFFQSSLTKKASSFALAVQLLLQCMMIGGASAQANDNDVNCTSTIAETICESELHGILCEALEMTGLDEDLAASEESWTVFAPTDDAFLALGDDNLEALLYNATTSGDPTATTVAADLLLFHVVQGAAMMVDDLPCEAGENLLTMANGEDSRTLCIDKVPAFQKGMYNEATRTDTFIEFQVTQQKQKQKQDAAAQHYAPLPAYISATQVCNGVIYTVDQVMLFEPLPFPIPPPTEEDTIVQQEEEEEEEEEEELQGEEEEQDSKPSLTIVDGVQNDDFHSGFGLGIVAGRDDHTEETTESAAGGSGGGGDDGGCLSIADLACSMDDLEAFCSIITEHDMATKLSESPEDGTKYTVFAPNDQAFMKDSTHTITSDELQFHVYEAAQALYMQDLNCVETIEMMNGKDSRTVCTDNDAVKSQKGASNPRSSMPELVAADKPACNGVLHIVSAIMKP